MKHQHLNVKRWVAEFLPYYGVWDVSSKPGIATIVPAHIESIVEVTYPKHKLVKKTRKRRFLTDTQYYEHVEIDRITLYKITFASGKTMLTDSDIRGLLY